MNLFGKKKEKTTCSCGGKCTPSVDPKNAKVIMLGGGCCKKSKETLENIQTVVKELGLEDEFAVVEDAVEIAKYGVLQTPGLVVDNKVVSMGKLIKYEDAKAYISQVK